ncbi:serine hydrolase [Rheinheimera baltica]|uniref:serine hydrolase n=1 Tax=Rheinheimera baltica TaxID=67576 RepID=UPI00273E8500|nr:serine hydrolase [Rheinheimera baltica]MDP5150881.1 serine hydrolase [Rheinheimera baltica]
MTKSVLLTISFLLSLSLKAEELSLPIAEINTQILRYVEEYNAPGLSVAVVYKNEVIFAKGYGWRDPENKLPVDTETVFHIGSITKAFTGALIGQLASEDKLELSARPSVSIPTLKFFNTEMDQRITLGDLLSHRSGIGDHGLSLVLFPEPSKSEMIKRLPYLKPQGEIGNSFIYSNIGYTLAGAIVETVTDRTWEEQIKQKLFIPLDMTHSSTSVAEMKQTNNYAYGYAKLGEHMVKVPFENYYSYSSAGAIKSSAIDLSKWMKVWLNEGKYNQKQVVPAGYIKQATRLQNIKSDPYTEDAFLQGEGYGWRLGVADGHFRVRHGGNTNGFSSVINMHPFEQLGIAVLSNQGNSVLPYIVSDLISRKILNLPESDYPIVVSEMYRPQNTEQRFNAEAMPTLELQRYVGKYHANGYGFIDVRLKNGTLIAKFPTFEFTLSHLNHDSFYLQGMPDFREDFNPEFTVMFRLDISGQIDGLNFHTQAGPVLFRKDRLQ